MSYKINQNNKISIVKKIMNIINIYNMMTNLKLVILFVKCYPKINYQT